MGNLLVVGDLDLRADFWMGLLFFLIEISIIVLLLSWLADRRWISARRRMKGIVNARLSFIMQPDLWASNIGKGERLLSTSSTVQNVAQTFSACMTPELLDQMTTIVACLRSLGFMIKQRETSLPHFGEVRSHESLLSELESTLTNFRRRPMGNFRRAAEAHGELLAWIRSAFRDMEC